MEIIKLGGFTGRLLHFFSRFTIAPGPTIVGTPLSSGVVWKSAGGTSLWRQLYRSRGRVGPWAPVLSGSCITMGDCGLC